MVSCVTKATPPEPGLLLACGIVNWFSIDARARAHFVSRLRAVLHILGQ